MVHLTSTEVPEPPPDEQEMLTEEEKRQQLADLLGEGYVKPIFDLVERAAAPPGLQGGVVCLGWAVR